MEDIPNTPEELRARFQELQEAYQGSVQLHLAAENMIDNLFNERLAAKNLLPIGNKGDHLLVETSYFQPPIDFRGTLERIKEVGYTPILAHPERYRYMDESDYEYLVSKNVKLQLNIISLAGGYGKPAQEKAQMLLSKGYYNFFGSDLHFLPHFMQTINKKSIKKDVATQLPNIQNALV
jgi:tyrosine-protein phosphatase YwqE